MRVLSAQQHPKIVVDAVLGPQPFSFFGTDTTSVRRRGAPRPPRGRPRTPCRLGKAIEEGHHPRCPRRLRAEVEWCAYSRNPTRVPASPAVVDSPGAQSQNLREDVRNGPSGNAPRAESERPAGLYHGGVAYPVSPSFSLLPAHAHRCRIRPVPVRPRLPHRPGGHPPAPEGRAGRLPRPAPQAPVRTDLRAVD